MGCGTTQPLTEGQHSQAPRDSLAGWKGLGQELGPPDASGPMADSGVEALDTT